MLTLSIDKYGHSLLVLNINGIVYLKINISHPYLLKCLSNFREFSSTDVSPLLSASLFATVDLDLALSTFSLLENTDENSP